MTDPILHIAELRAKAERLAAANPYAPGLVSKWEAVCEEERATEEFQRAANPATILALLAVVEAAQKVFDHLNDRLDRAIADRAPLPVFTGIVDLHNALRRLSNLARKP